MNLTYLQYQLSYHGLKNIRLQSHRECQFSSWKLYEGNQEWKKDVLYVVPAEELSEIAGGLVEDLQDQAFLVTDYPKDSNLPGINGVYLDGKSPFAQILNLLHEIFRDYERWEFALFYSGEMALDTILELAAPVLHMPMTIINNEFRFIAKNSSYARLFPEDYLKQEEIDTVIWEENFRECTHRKGVFHFYLESIGKDLLCFNIVISNRFYARLLASIERPGYEKIQERLFEQLARCIEYVFEEQKVTPYRSVRSREFYEAINLLLDGKQVPDLFILSQNDWLPEDEYQIIVLRFSRYFPVEEGGQYLHRQLQKIFPECCVLERNRDFICVRNQRAEKKTEYDFREKLAVFLRDNVAKAGVSHNFKDVQKLHLYLNQAYDALKIGERKDPHFWYYGFENYTFDYLMQQCTVQYPAIEVTAPALNMIRKMDEEKGTDLYESLKIYLELGGNASQSAEKLYIHRSSLMKRLNKIEKVTGIDLENADTRLYLMISYQLLEMKG